MPTRLTVAKPPAVVFCVNQLCQRRKCMKRYDTHQGSMSLYLFEFSGMPSIRLLTFLDAQCPGWERRPVEVVHLHLARFGENNSASNIAAEDRFPKFSNCLRPTAIMPGSG
ncbi:hypothetical protein B9Z55_028882 [Caenorhabditis nigoni]|uniref:Uncharacterized protein n=1 Tax=Caenorhabditis nigoni TaxID=1611254 RepID=A0A2G5SA07_9PELO|nr:hypothetical protein B9Z55_028882 [Caenorhabditis nigoni]